MNLSNIDTSKIGDRMAIGGVTFVYHYGENHVIKFCFVAWLIGDRLSVRLKNDYQICKKYFPEYVTKTIFITTEKHQHIEIQPRIDGEHLQRKHLQNRNTQKQFKKIVKGLKTMQTNSIGDIDLVGNRGIFAERLSNIIVDKDSNLHIVDATLLTPDNIGFLGYLFYPFLVLARHRQSRIIDTWLS